jgi:hypothetical protein
MGSAREYVVNTLAADSDLGQIVTRDRIKSGGSMMTAQLTRPYIVVSMMNAPDLGWDDPDVPARPRSQYFMVYVHNDRASYVQLDSICELVKNAFRLNPSSPDDKVVWTTFLEQSSDFDNVSLDTVFRYMRFIATLT